MPKTKKERKAAKIVAPIVIDKEVGLVFKTEKQLFEYFEEKVAQIEEEYYKLRRESDLSEAEISSYEKHLEATLDDPDQVWRDQEVFKGQPTVFHYLKRIPDVTPKTYYIATAYIDTDENPTFIFFHFATQDMELVNQYVTGELAFDKDYEAVGPGSIEGDGLTEGDPLAIGLYLSMMKIRGDKDIPEADFQKYGELREETIESADEIWRTIDMSGNVLVVFIKEFPEHEKSNLTYVAVTQEDESSRVHALLYSFPSVDTSLVDRFRRGENLQTEEISQESSH